MSTTGQYYVFDIPNPITVDNLNNVSNPDHILQDSAVNKLNEWTNTLDSLTGIEYAIVVVDDFEGDDVFDFALELFNSWGIGDIQANTGLLLFVSKERREYRFISGYGLESILPDAYLKRIGQTYLVPNFKNDAFDKGVLEASKVIINALKSPNATAELDRIIPKSRSFWHWENVILQNSILVLFCILASFYWIGFVAHKNFGPRKSHRTNWIIVVFISLGCMLFLMFLSIFVFGLWLNNIKEIYSTKNLPYFLLVFGMILISILQSEK